VLIVDDSPIARRHERSRLESLGFSQIAEATDGAQAIATAAREPFDLIVTDYNMPLMDGPAFRQLPEADAGDGGHSGGHGDHRDGRKAPGPNPGAWA